MIKDVREQYNASFTPLKYAAFLNYISKQGGTTPQFRIAETPVFVPDDLKNRLLEACDQLSDTLCRSDFKEISQSALDDSYSVPNEDDKPLFLQMDFAICADDDGSLVPQLIEIQGFPSLYFYQNLASKAYKIHFEVSDEFTHLFGGLDEESYLDRLSKAILNGHNHENVVLLEIEPSKQVTYIDFLLAQKYTGLKILCISDLHNDGKDLFYWNEYGKKIPVHRIFNRVIFDELLQKDISKNINLVDEYNVEFAGHPNWFFRISKHTLPFLKHKYVPNSVFLSEIQSIPDNLEDYVLKPLFSFSGSGVVYHVNKKILQKLTGDPKNYILQKKVKYEPVIESPDGKVKCEIRMLMLWEDHLDRPEVVSSLVRLTKGEMVGVKYNKNKDWVGGSAGFFRM